MNPSLKAIVLSVSLAAGGSFAATPDGLITARAKLALWTSEVRSRSVNVDTHDGIITLSGRVPTQEQKALAEQKTRELAGVRSVKSFLQVVSPAEEKQIKRSDKEVKAAVKFAIDNDAALKTSDVSVKNVNDGVVLLKGEAATVSALLRAIELADRTPGVRRVGSEVKSPEGIKHADGLEFSRADGPAAVTPRSPDERAAAEPPSLSDERSGPSDMGITMSVKMRLLTTPELPSSEIRVDTTDKVVTLFGIVPTEEIKRVAEKETAGTTGVRSVKNELQVVASSQKEVVEKKDVELEGALEAAFKKRRELRDVKFEVKNGVVQLTGRVASPSDEYEAVRAARQLDGVRNVVDQLKVDEKRRGDRPGS